MLFILSLLIFEEWEEESAYEERDNKNSLVFSLPSANQA
jgi:hypothetical protein